MDPVCPSQVPEGHVPDGDNAMPQGAAETQPCSGNRAPAVQPPCPPCDTASILTSGPLTDTASILTSGPLTDTDSIQTSHADSSQAVHMTYDTDSNQTTHLAYDTDSNQTLNPSYDTDSTRTLHNGYPVDRTERMAADGASSQTGADGPSTSHATNALCPTSDEPPPYSPPDPKLTYLIYPPPLPHYAGPPVVACQQGANQPGFYQPQFMPSTSYPSYAIYMNSPPLGEEQPPLPKDYLVESLLVTIFCCLMSGLIALVYSYETRAALARGDIREGERASQKARLLVMFSLMFGVFAFVGWIIYVVIALCA